jgi:NAD(P)-dependent dehydrogenase (short-subunit alcohol dehydrogenase family)
MIAIERSTSLVEVEPQVSDRFKGEILCVYGDERIPGNQERIHSVSISSILEDSQLKDRDFETIIYYQSLEPFSKSLVDPKTDSKQLDLLVDTIFEGIYRLISKGLDGGSLKKVVAITRQTSWTDAFLVGCLKCLTAEIPDLVVRSISVEDEINSEQLAKLVETELSTSNSVETLTRELSYQGESYKVPVMKPLESEDCAKSARPLKTILVTGGARGVVPVMLGYLVRQQEQSPCHIILTGRTVLADDSTDEQADEVRNTLKLLEGENVTVEYRCLDVSRIEQVFSLLEETVQKYGSIDLVVHAAGVAINETFVKHLPSQLATVLQVKIAPLIAVWQACQSNLKIGQVISLSSAAALLGNIKQSSYAAANLMLERLCDLLDRQSIPSSSLAFSGLDGGMVTPGLKQIMDEMGITVIKSNEFAPLLWQMCQSRGGRQYTYLSSCDYFQSLVDKPGELLVWRDRLEKLSWLSDVKFLDNERCLAVQIVLSERDRAGLDDHRFYGVPVVPASKILSWCTAIIREYNPLAKTVHIRQFKFNDLCVLVEGNEKLVAQASLKKEDDSITLAFEFYCDKIFAAAGELSLVLDEESQFDFSGDLSVANQQTLEPKPQELYDRGTICLGSGYHVVNKVDRLAANGVVCKLAPTDCVNGLELAFESIAQTHAAYAAYNYNVATFPFDVRDVFVYKDAINQHDGVTCSLRLLHCPPRLPTFSGSVEVKDSSSKAILINGGPWLNVYSQIYDSGSISSPIKGQFDYYRITTKDFGVHNESLSLWDHYVASADNEIIAEMKNVMGLSSDDEVMATIIMAKDIYRYLEQNSAMVSPEHLKIERCAKNEVVVKNIDNGRMRTIFLAWANNQLIGLLKTGVNKFFFDPFVSDLEIKTPRSPEWVNLTAKLDARCGLARAQMLTRRFIEFVGDRSGEFEFVPESSRVILRTQDGQDLDMRYKFMMLTGEEYLLNVAEEIKNGNPT